MSYTIIYDRCFIKTSMGITPVILSGSNNCTEPKYFGQRGPERRVRSWGVYNTDLFDVPAEMILDKVSEWTKDECDQNEFFKWHGKFVFRDGFIKFFVNGIKNAKTIEEIVEKLGHGVNCYLSVTNYSIPFSENGHYRQEISEYVRTTSEYEDWVKKAKAYIAGSEIGESVYPIVDFCTKETIGFDRRSSDTAGPVVIKVGRAYVKDIAYKRYSYSSDPKGCIVFDSIDAAKTALSGLGWVGANRFTFVSAKSALKEKPYVLRVSEGVKQGYYIYKLSSTTLRFAETASYAKTFVSEKAALKWASEKILDRFQGVKDVVVECTKDVA